MHNPAPCAPFRLSGCSASERRNCVHIPLRVGRGNSRHVCVHFGASVLSGALTAVYFRALEIPLMFDMFFLFASGFRAHVCSIQDYWEGYKLLCYAYYSHSMQHEYDFQQSKLGSLLAYSICFFSLGCWYAPLVLARLLRCSSHFTNSPPSLLLYRATGLEAPCQLSSSFPPYAPNNMHADPSSCRDVL